MVLCRGVASGAIEGKGTVNEVAGGYGTNQTA